MKKIILFLIFTYCVFSFCNAQDSKQRLISEIKESNTIECYYLGQAARPSALFKKADTLNTLLSMKEKIQLFADSNRVLKYYCFYNIMSENDSIAFELLKQCINDTTDIGYNCGCTIDDLPLNWLLVEKYNMFIQAKYRDGSPTVMGDSKRVHMFPKADKKKYKEKHNQLVLLVNQSVSKDRLLRVVQ